MRSLAVIVAWILLVVAVSAALCRPNEGESRVEACLSGSGRSL